MNKFNIITHAHSLYSYDGTLTLEEIKSKCVKNNISIIFMCEHAHKGMNDTKYKKFIHDCEQLSDDTFRFVPGLEFNSKDGPHIIIYGLEEYVDLTHKEVKIICQYAADKGLLSVFAHPKRQRYLIDKYINIVDIVEGCSSNYDKYSLINHYKFIRDLIFLKKKFITGIDLHLNVQFEDVSNFYNLLMTSKKINEISVNEMLLSMRPFFYGHELNNFKSLYMSKIKCYLKNSVLNKIKTNKIKRSLRRKIYSQTNIIPNEIEIKSDEKLLIIAPHPDDESIGCGGLLISNSNLSRVLCLTDGRYGGGKKINEVMRTRKIELQEAMSSIGVDYSFMNIPDGDVINDLDFSKIDLTDITRVFIPHGDEQHHDHSAISYLLREKLLNDKGLYSLFKGIKISFYEVWNPLPIVNEFIDISDIIDKKERLINHHKSQTSKINYSEKIISLASYRGLSVNVEYAECYLTLSCEQFLKY